MRKDIQEYYRTLGLNPGAAPADIKRAYRQLIQRWHPDHFKGGSIMQTTAEDLTKEINEAYEQLIKKQLYKRYLPKPEPKAAATRSPFAASAQARRAYERAAAQRREKARAAAAPPSRPGPAVARSPWPWGKMAGVFAAVVTGGVVWWTLPSLGGLHRPEIRAPVRARAGTFAAVPPAARAPTPVPVSASSGPIVANAAPKSEMTAVEAPSSPGPSVIPATPDAARPGILDVGSRMGYRASDGARWSPLSGLDRSAPAFAVPRPSWSGADTPVARVSAVPAAEWEALFRRASAMIDTFERGDTKARVLAIQGAPDDRGADIFRYGSAVIYFKDDRVTGWSDGIPRLRVRSLPSLDYDLLATFDVGATRDEVLRVQGRPTDALLDAYLYGSSVVYFEHDRVTRWLEGTTSLRTQLIQPLALSRLDELMRR